MKRSKNINLTALKKKQAGFSEDVTPLIVMGLVGAGAFGLYSLISSSGSSSNESYHNGNYTQYSGACCVSASKTFDNLQSCQPIDNKAYDTNNACEVTVKANGQLNTFNIYKGQCSDSTGQKCSTTHAQGSNWAIPAAMLFLATSSNRGYYNYPVSQSPNTYNSSSNNNYRKTNNSYHQDQKYTVTKNKAPTYKPTTTSTKSRGGFGSTSSSKSYWGSSRSSRSSWGG